MHREAPVRISSAEWKLQLAFRDSVLVPSR